jgi:hypothetical protein
MAVLQGVCTSKLTAYITRASEGGVISIDGTAAGGSARRALEAIELDEAFASVF